MKILAITNNKGGVGKTTTALNVAAALAEAGHRVLLIDLDDQGNLSYALGAPMTSPHNVGAFLLAPTRDVRQWPLHRVSEALDLLPSHEHLGDYLNQVQSKADYEYRLRDQLALRCPPGAYDYAVLDCPPSLTDGMTFMAFCAATAYAIPTDAEPLSVLGLRRMMALATKMQEQRNPGLRFAGFVLTRYNPDVRGALRQQMVADVRAKYGEGSIVGNVRQDVALSEAQALRTTVFAYAPASRGAQDYQKLTQSILARL